MTNTPEKITYSVSATNIEGGREGRSVSTDPDFKVSLNQPGKGDGTNPEQLFAIGWGACFNGALALAAKESGDSIDGSQVRATVDFGPEGDSFALAAKIEVFVPGLDVEKVQQLAERTHELCPYSKATAGNVPTEVVAVESL